MVNYKTVFVMAAIDAIRKLDPKGGDTSFSWEVQENGFGVFLFAPTPVSTGVPATRGSRRPETA